ncbi:hypothetical protein BH11BAC3_BH11BAC3_37110 [soil metagenome]
MKIGFKIAIRKSWKCIRSIFKVIEHITYLNMPEVLPVKGILYLAANIKKHG